MTDEGPLGGGVIAGSPDSTRSVTTSGVLTSAVQKLARTPSALGMLLLAGVVVAGIDWLQLRDPVPSTTYEGIEQGRIAVAFYTIVTVVSRANTPASAVLNLKQRWLLTTVGLELLELLVVILAGSYALARLLSVEITFPAVLRYGLVVSLVRSGLFEVTFEGGSMVLAVPLLVGLFVVMVRLVPLPGRILLGEPIGTALRRSWASTREYGWQLFGIVLVIGLATHLFASLPLVGPIGTAGVAAVHAGAVAVLISRLPSPSGDLLASTGSRP